MHDSSKQKTLIFLHGGPGFRDYLEPYFSELASDNIQCVFYNQLQADSVSIDDLVKQLDQYVDNSQTDIYLIGHSWGGSLATEYTLRFQDKLKGLILINTVLDKDQFVYYETYLKEQGLANLDKKQIFFPDNEMEEGEKLMNSSAWVGLCHKSFESIYNGYLKHFDLLTKLGEIKIPILNIWSDKDLRCPRVIGASFKSYNQDIIEFEIKGSGHFPFILEHNKQEIYNHILDLVLSTCST